MNILRKRYEFHQRQQQPHEAIEDFASEIRRLASFCEYETLEETLIRDHVLFGLCDNNITLEIIENGGDPTLFDVIDFYSKAVPTSTLKLKSYEINSSSRGTAKIHVKNEPEEGTAVIDAFEGNSNCVVNTFNLSFIIPSAFECRFEYIRQHRL